MNGNRLNLLLLFFVLILVNILVAIAFGIGVLVTYPLSVIAYMFIYDRVILKKAEPKEEIVAQPVEIPVHTGPEHEGENPHQHD